MSWSCLNIDSLCLDLGLGLGLENCCLVNITANLVGVRPPNRLHFFLQALDAKFLVFDRLLQLQSTVADRLQVTTGGRQAVLQCIVLVFDLGYLLLMPTADETPPYLLV